MKTGTSSTLSLFDDSPLPGVQVHRAVNPSGSGFSVCGANMFKRILLPTDFSDHSRRAFDCITGFPAVTDIILLHVIDTPRTSPSSMKRDHEEHVQDLLKQDQNTLKNLGLFVTTCTENIFAGTIPECIESVAKAENVNLIVMSAGNPGLIKGFHFGSVTYGVIHHSNTNLCIIRNPVIEGMSGERYDKFCPLILSKVLVPVDLSPQSFEAVRILSDAQGIGEMILMHVVPWGESKESLDARVSQAYIIIGQFCGELKKKGISATGDVLLGDPVPTIIRYADEADVSAICVIPSGKSRLQEMVYGSFTCDLAGLNTRPTLILKNIIRP